MRGPIQSPVRIHRNPTFSYSKWDASLSENKQSGKRTCADLKASVVDFSQSHEKRMRDLLFLCKQFSDQAFELLDQLRSMFRLTQNTRVFRILHECAETMHDFPVTTRLDIADLLSQFVKTRNAGFDVMHEICSTENLDQLPKESHAKYLICLVNTNRFPDAEEMLFDLCNDPKIQVLFRYETLLSLKHMITKNRGTLTRGMWIFVMNGSNCIRYRILACQALLTQCGLPSEDRVRVEQILFEIARNTDNDENTRADALDIIQLHTSSNETAVEANKMLTELGGGATVYENKQNAHTVSVVASALESIALLYEYTKSQTLPAFDDVVADITRLADAESERTGTIVRSVINRIRIDRSDLNAAITSLRELLCNIYLYISNHPKRTNLERILIQEMVDTDGTCATGYAERLINTLSGFGEFKVTISWEDQIRANIHARLNAKLISEPDRDTILTQMVDRNIADRTTFLTFFMQQFPSIREDMYMEFSDHMTDTDWELYVQKAVVSYGM